MKKLLVFLFLLLCSQSAFAEVQRNPCYYTGAGPSATSGCVPVSVVNPMPVGGSTYNTIAASQTTQVLTGGGGGAKGDYLDKCIIQPTVVSAGTMIIFDNLTTVFTFTSGTLVDLKPIEIDIGAVSVSGAWNVTTGASETVTCMGKFK